MTVPRWHLESVHCIGGNVRKIRTSRALVTLRCLAILFTPLQSITYIESEVVVVLHLYAAIHILLGPVHHTRAPELVQIEAHTLGQNVITLESR